MNVPEDLLYTESHDHAQAELTDVVYVELPKMGATYDARGTIAIVESVKAASDIYAPAKGTVSEINRELESNPALVNTDPYGEGWIYVMLVENPDQLKDLKDAAAYKAMIG